MANSEDLRRQANQKMQEADQLTQQANQRREEAQRFAKQAADEDIRMANEQKKQAEAAKQRVRNNGF